MGIRSGRCPRGRFGANSASPSGSPRCCGCFLRECPRPPRVGRLPSRRVERKRSGGTRTARDSAALRRSVGYLETAGVSLGARERPRATWYPPRRSARHSGAGRLSTTRTIGHGQDPPFLRVPRRPPACVGGYAAATRPRDAPSVYPATRFSTSARQPVFGSIWGSVCSCHGWLHHLTAPVAAADRPVAVVRTRAGNRRQDNEIREREQVGHALNGSIISRCAAPRSRTRPRTAIRIREASGSVRARRGASRCRARAGPLLKPSCVGPRAGSRRARRGRH
jgi:hypothetical protein